MLSRRFLPTGPVNHQTAAIGGTCRFRPRLKVSEDHDDYDDLPAGDGILILSSEQVILSATLQAERLLRTRLEPGQTVALSEIFPEPYLAQAELALKETLNSGVLRAQLL